MRGADVVGGHGGTYIVIVASSAPSYPPAKTIDDLRLSADNVPEPRLAPIIQNL